MNPVRTGPLLAALPRMARTSVTRERRGLVVWQLALIILVVAVIAVAVTCYGRRRVAVTNGAPAPGAPDVRRAPGAPSASPLDMAVKPTPTEITYEGCAPEGDNPRMGELNRWKNRIDSAAWRTVAIDTLLALPWPKTIERLPPARWSAADRAAIDRYNGIPVSVEGYLANARESGPESPNCHGADNAYQDWHVWLTPAPGPDRTRALVVETTPRVRAGHPAWTLAKLRRLSRDSTRVRISGWLMMDPEHPDQIGKTRGTIWEVHPIMRIEVQRGASWISLDDPAALPRGR